MRKVCVLILLALMASVPAFAQDANQARLVAEELLVLNNVDANAQRMLKQVKDLQMAQLKELGLSQEKTGEVETLQARLFEILEAELSWDSMKEEYIDIYTQVFTLEELQALLEFTRSEMGRRINEKMPLLMEKSMQIGQIRAQKAIPKMQQILEEYISKN